MGPQIEVLRRVLLPDAIARCGNTRRLRIWSAGCSSGEEPYTVAILLREQLPLPESWDVDILATDINVAAIETARRGVYGQWSFRDTPSVVRDQYFSPEGNRHWRIVDSIRRMVRFVPLNLTADSLPWSVSGGTTFNIILCRNVTIYFSAEATQRLYRRFAEVLADGGWLVLGPSDPPPGQARELEHVYLPGVVLWRRITRGQTSSNPVPASLRNVTSKPRNAPPTASKQSSIATQARQPAPPKSDAIPDLQAVQALAHAGDRTTARHQAELVARARPLDADAHLLLGMLCLDDGDATAALDSLRRASFLDTNNPLIHFSLGRALLQSGDSGRGRSALIHARRLLAAAPDDEVIVGGNGLVAGELRQALDAELQSSEALTRDR